jgi:mRNA interferase MazF
VIFDRYDIVALPHPLNDTHPSGRRPAVVLSTRNFNISQGHTLCAMVTSSSGGWSSDVPIVDLDTAGLPVPSVIRLKLFVVENAKAEKRLGELARKDAKALRRALRTALGEDD